MGRELISRVTTQFPRNPYGLQAHLPLHSRTAINAGSRRSFTAAILDQLHAQKRFLQDHFPKCAKTGLQLPRLSGQGDSSRTYLFIGNHYKKVDP